jgi:hypothetical protein
MARIGKALLELFENRRRLKREYRTRCTRPIDMGVFMPMSGHTFSFSGTTETPEKFLENRNKPKLKLK